MGVQKPATITPFSETQLLKALTDVYQSELGGPPATATVCVLAAQIALETANGKKCIQYNVGNFKQPNAAPPVNNPNLIPTDYCYFATTEYDSQGIPHVILPPNPGCLFQAFDTLEQGLTAYMRSMYNHWTEAWRAAYIGNPEGFARGLKARGYYTAPVESYVKGLMAWFSHYMAIAALQPNQTLPPAPPQDYFSDIALGYLGMQA